MISISECFDEDKCEGKKSCFNELNIGDQPAVVFTNKTSFVGVQAIVQAKCGLIEIPANYCLNGGTLDYSGSCVCLDGFDGPRCEVLSIGFRGDGWALYRNFEAFDSIRIHLQILAEKENGLIFYVGPLSSNPQPIVRGKVFNIQNVYNIN